MVRQLLAALLLGVVLGPLPQGEHGLPWLVDDLLAELDRLGQDDLFLGVEQRHLADLLEVHPDRIVDADHVGGDRVQLLLGRLVGLLGVELGRRLFPRLLARLVDGHLDAQLGGYGQAGVVAEFVVVLGAHEILVDVAALAALEDARNEQLVSGVGHEFGNPPGESTRAAAFRLRRTHELPCQVLTRRTMTILAS